jgi:hypothetical protein
VQTIERPSPLIRLALGFPPREPPSPARGEGSEQALRPIPTIVSVVSHACEIARGCLRRPVAVSSSRSEMSEGVKRRQAPVRDAAPRGPPRGRACPLVGGDAGPSRGPARLSALHRGAFRTSGAALFISGRAGISANPSREVVVPPGDPGAARDVRLARPDPRAPHPAPPNSATGWRLGTSGVIGI